MLDYALDDDDDDDDDDVDDDDDDDEEVDDLRARPLIHRLRHTVDVVFFLLFSFVLRMTSSMTSSSSSSSSSRRPLSPLLIDGVFAVEMTSRLSNRSTGSIYLKKKKRKEKKRKKKTIKNGSERKKKEKKSFRFASFRCRLFPTPGKQNKRKTHRRSKSKSQHQQQKKKNDDKQADPIGNHTDLFGFLLSLKISKKSGDSSRRS